MARSTSGSLTPAARAITSEMVSGTPGRVHHAVADEPAVGPGELVAPRADDALAVGGLQREPPQARHDRVVAGGHLVFGEQHDDIAVIPGLPSLSAEKPAAHSASFLTSGRYFGLPLASSARALSERVIGFCLVGRDRRCAWPAPRSLARGCAWTSGNRRERWRCRCRAPGV